MICFWPRQKFRNDENPWPCWLKVDGPIDQPIGSVCVNRSVRCVCPAQQMVVDLTDQDRTYLMKDCTVEDVRRSWNTDSMIHVYICPRTARFKMLVSRSGNKNNTPHLKVHLRSDQIRLSGTMDIKNILVFKACGCMCCCWAAGFQKFSMQIRCRSSVAGNRKNLVEHKS